MGKVTCDMSMSLDGFVAGPHQSLANPLGEGAEDRLHRWMFEEAEANAAELQAITAAGAFIMGRNMFGPGRDDWDLEWKGWWGDEPPYHGPVFVLTHHPRPALPMRGGTTFSFVTDGIESALAQARRAAGEGDIAIAGGAHTVNQYLAAGPSTSSACTSRRCSWARASGCSTASETSPWSRSVPGAPTW